MNGSRCYIIKEKIEKSVKSMKATTKTLLQVATIGLLTNTLLTGCESQGEKDIKGEWSNGLNKMEFQDNGKLLEYAGETEAAYEGEYSLEKDKDKKYKLHTETEDSEGNAIVWFSEDGNKMYKKQDNSDTTATVYTKAE